MILNNKFTTFIKELSKDKIFTGVGSDDVIGMAFNTFFHSDEPVLFADITYSFYEVWAELVGFTVNLIPVKDDFTIDINDYRISNGGIVIANPNAPTGIPLPLSKIEEVLKFNTDSVVIVDEAYVDFGGESAISLIDKYDNLLVTQTYSKSRNLAGLRVGMAYGNPEIIAKLKAVKFATNSYTMNEPTLRIASAILKDEDYFRECCKKVTDTREWSVKEFKALGFDVPRFGHLGMILAPDRSKLSKRHGATAVSEFVDNGYLTDALVNFVALLGWAPSDGEEIKPVEEIAADFRIGEISSSNSIFEYDKLKWMNSHYIKQIPIDKLKEML